MTIKEIYSRYPIPRNLQRHMIEVAAVNQYVGEHFRGEVDVELLVLEGLSHDLGNLIKFKLDLYPELLEGDVYEWKDKQLEMIEKYGNDEHEATIEIARQAGFPEKVITLLPLMGSRYFQEILDGDDWVRKICQYGDMRVMPKGIVTIDERFDDARIRYVDKGLDHINGRHQMALELERALQERVDIDLSMITDELLEKRIETLWEWEV